MGIFSHDKEQRFRVRCLSALAKVCLCLLFVHARFAPYDARGDQTLGSSIKPVRPALVATESSTPRRLAWGHGLKYTSRWDE